jgi:hypothetical protein
MSDVPFEEGDQLIPDYEAQGVPVDDTKEPLGDPHAKIMEDINANSTD